MARHADVTLATDMPIYFVRPHSPWERPSSENTNGLIREYLPKGTHITGHHLYLDELVDGLNGRPRDTVGYFTAGKAFAK